MNYHLKYTGPVSEGEVTDFYVEAGTPDEGRNIIAYQIYPRRRFISQVIEDARQAFKELLVVQE